MPHWYVAFLRVIVLTHTFVADPLKTARSGALQSPRAALLCRGARRSCGAAYLASVGRPAGGAAPLSAIDAPPHCPLSVPPSRRFARLQIISSTKAFHSSALFYSRKNSEGASVSDFLRRVPGTRPALRAVEGDHPR